MPPLKKSRKNLKRLEEEKIRLEGLVKDEKEYLRIECPKVTMIEEKGKIVNE
jgi:hypothetical protein